MEQESNRLLLSLISLVKLGEDLLREELLSKSPLSQRDGPDERRELEKLRFKEITSVADVILILTGREFSLQWQKSPDGDHKGGIALFEIMADAPCEKSHCWGPDRRVDWGKGLEQGKIVKIYELIYDRKAKQHYTGRFLTPEFQPSEL
jgi:hypothetical protein